jgi:hypothetical protein
MNIEDQITYDPTTGLFKWLNPVYPKRTGWIAGSDDGSGYLCFKINGSKVKAHRLAWYLMQGKWPDNIIDHVDSNKTNNKLSNLRDVSLSVNQQNRKKAQINSLSGLLGVKKNRSRWSAAIRLNGYQTHLGTYDTPEEAHAVYLEAKRKIHEGNTL